MTDFVIRYDLALLIAHDAVFLLFSTDRNKLKCIKQIGLVYKLSAIFYCVDGSLIDHICKIRSYESGCCQCKCIKIYGLIHHDIFGMNL